MSSVLDFIRSHHPWAIPTAIEYIGVPHELEALGAGVAGAVFKTPNSTAIKIHKEKENYEQEIAVYRRLSARRIREINGFHVPQLVNSLGRLNLIEMSIVTVPYLLDFAGCRLDKPHGFDPEVEADWWERMRDRFDENFEQVETVYYELIHRCKIYYSDFKPGNIEFAKPQDRPSR